MASAYSEMHSIVKAISDYLYPFKSPIKASTVKHQQRMQLRELCRKRAEAVEEIEISHKIIEWFKSLDSDSRVKATTHKNPTISAFLHEMYTLSFHDGPHFFTLNNPKHSADSSFASYFTSRKKNLEELLHSSQKIEHQLECFLRFCDKDAYCDCISIDPDISAEDLLQIIKSLSGDKAFQVPCRISWSSAGNAWSWDYPAWFGPGNSYSMAAVACASIERAMWARFWNSHDLDPRCPGETMTYKKEDTEELVVGELTRFMDALDHDKKIQIIGGVDKHLEMHHQVKAFFEQNSLFFSNGDNTSKLQVVKYEFDSMLFIIPNKSQPSKSIETISVKFHEFSCKQFIEFLFFTQLDRLGINFDIVSRKILLSIISAYSDKKAEDLIKESKSVLIVPKCTKPKKKRKPIKKNNKQNKPLEPGKNPLAVDPCKEIDRDSMDEPISSIELQTKSQIISSNKEQSIFPIASSPVKQPSTNTLTQVNNKKFFPREAANKQFKRPQSYRNPKKVFNASIHKSQSTKTSAQVTPTKPEQVSTKFQWSHVSEPISYANIDSFEFPPLCSSQSTPVPFSSLHFEIIRFCSNTSKKVKEKYHEFTGCFQELMLLITKVHPEAFTAMYGSYGSGLALETSDIDVVVNLLPLPDRKQIQEACVKLSEDLKQSPIVLKCHAITTAKIPVIKVETKAYSIDITYEDESQSHQGVKAVDFTMNLLYMYPQLRELSLVLKHLLYTHGLNSSYHGGLNSYSLLLWITAAFNSMQYYEEDLGNLLMYFLDFFGNCFDSTTSGINIINGGSIYQLPHRCYENVVTIDPLSMQNMTGNLYLIDQLQQCFREAHSKLKELKETPCGKNILSYIFKSSN